MKHKHMKGLAIVVTMSVLLFAAVGIVLAVDYVQVIDFSTYASNTNAEAINEPGVTFDVVEGAARTVGSYLRINPDTNFDPSTVVMHLDQPAKMISFDYKTYGNCGYPVNTIQLYDNGALVDNTTVNSCDNGTYSRSMAFDEVRITAGRVTNLEVADVGTITLTYTLTKEDCKDGGWEALGYRNQGQCVSDTNH